MIIPLWPGAGPQVAALRALLVRGPRGLVHRHPRRLRGKSETETETETETEIERSGDVCGWVGWGGDWVSRGGGRCCCSTAAASAHFPADCINVFDYNIVLKSPCRPQSALKFI